MAVSVEKRLLTVEEYNEMGRVGILGPSDKVELIHGEIIKMSPIGSKHANTVNKLNEVLRNFISKKVIISIQNPVVLDEINEPQPDISILMYREDFYGKILPTSKDIYALIEVSGTSIAYDKEVKTNLYAKAGIPEYWIIDIENDQLEIYSNAEKDRYKDSQIFMKEDELVSYLINDKVKVEDLLI